jgi:hypothetical protein
MGPVKGKQGSMGLRMVIGRKSLRKCEKYHDRISAAETNVQSTAGRPRTLGIGTCFDCV